LASIAPEEITRLLGLPVTTAARTLIDLGNVADASIVERALESALRQRLVMLPGLAQRTSEIPSMGGRRLSRVLAARPAGVAPTESDAETLFVLLARSMGLPDPQRQFTVILRGRAYRLDFAWPALRLAIEIDGAAAHGPDRLSADLHRQNQILLDAWLIVRFTWWMLVRRPDLVERDLRTAWELRTVASAWG
jgi:very-short-patch-repair endonuclease